MLRQAFKALGQDHALLISLIALIPSRNAVSLQQTNFFIWVGAEKYGLSYDDARDVWRTQNIIANACALP